LLVVGAAVALAIGSYSALAGAGPVTSVAGAVIGADGPDDGDVVEDADDDVDDVDAEGEDGDNGEGDVDGDPDGDTSGDPDGDAGGDVEAGNDNGGQDNGPGTGHVACSAATEHARLVLQGLLAAGKPVGNAIAVVGACGTGAGGQAEAAGGDGSTHPGKGHAFGRGHDHGEPEGVSANGDSEDGGDGPPEHAPAYGRR
jgi:hypothetical protein